MRPGIVSLGAVGLAAAILAAITALRTGVSAAATEGCSDWGDPWAIQRCLERLALLEDQIEALRIELIGNEANPGGRIGDLNEGLNAALRFQVLAEGKFDGASFSFQSMVEGLSLSLLADESRPGGWFPFSFSAALPSTPLIVVTPYLLTEGREADGAVAFVVERTTLGFTIQMRKPVLADGRNIVWANVEDGVGGFEFIVLGVAP